MIPDRIFPGAENDRTSDRLPGPLLYDRARPRDEHKPGAEEDQAKDEYEATC